MVNAWEEAQFTHFSDEKAKLIYKDDSFEYFLHITDKEKDKYYNNEMFNLYDSQHIKDVDREKCLRDGILTQFSLETPLDYFRYYYYSIRFDDDDFNKVKNIYTDDKNKFKDTYYPLKNILDCNFDDDKKEMKCAMTNRKKIEQTYEVLGSNPYHVIMDISENIISKLDEKSAEYLCETHNM